jgi:4-amino-4-deoxy-L-arabinose transferase-like glycosyltransferase
MTQFAPPIAYPQRATPWFVAGAALTAIFTLVALILPTPLWLEMFTFLTLAWWLPGLLLALLFRLPQSSLPALLLHALGVGLCWLIAGALLVHYIPGAISRSLLLAVFAGGIFILVVVTWLCAPAMSDTGDGKTWRWALVLLLFTAVLRLPGLGYHEFHADEAVLLRQAQRAVEGQDDALAEHTKGPGEIAVTLAVYRALNTASEATHRLPFALMSVGSVLALAWLGTRMFDGSTGVWAGILLATNGFALGLSRIAQYQPAVLLFSVLAVLSMWEFSRAGDRRWLAPAVAYSAFGIVMHYEFVLLAPSLLYLAWIGWQRTPDRRAVATALLAGAATAVFVVAAAYLPALLNPHFSTTQGYLSNRMGSVGTFNLAFFAEMGTFYNATFYFFVLVALVVAGTALGWRRSRQPALALTLWWLPFFILYIFIVRFPGTHFYLLMESWSLLAAIPLAMAGGPSMRPAIRWTVLVLAGVWLAISSYYLYLMFFRQDPEYLINIKSERVPFYWAPFPVPEKPRFGFPIQEGWKVIGTLGAWGYLPGSSVGEDGEIDSTYNSNDRAWSLRRWYLTPFSKRDFEEQPDYVFVSRHVQEDNPEYAAAETAGLLDGYAHTGEVRVRGEPRLEIWARTPSPAYGIYDAEDFSAPFLRDVAALELEPDPPVRVEEVALGDTVTLQSAHLAKTTYRPGDTIPLLLVWRAEQELPIDYKLFVHVAGEDGRPVAQWDGFPGLNSARTSRWLPGEPFRDHAFVTIPDDAPVGEYTLLAGLYDGESGARLGDAAVPIATIHIR